MTFVKFSMFYSYIVHLILIFFLSQVNHLSPELLRQEGMPVYRCVQTAGQFVLTFPRAYHSSLNCGFNCAELVNVAPVDWLPHGQNAVELYRERGWRILISHDKLLLRAVNKVVRAWWSILFSGENLPEDFRWKNIDLYNDILPKALKVTLYVNSFGYHFISFWLMLTGLFVD